MFDSLSVYDKADCCPFIETLDESTFKLFWPDWFYKSKCIDRVCNKIE